MNMLLGTVSLRETGARCYSQFPWLVAKDPEVLSAIIHRFDHPQHRQQIEEFVLAASKFSDEFNYNLALLRKCERDILSIGPAPRVLIFEDQTDVSKLNKNSAVHYGVIVPRDVMAAIITMEHHRVLRGLMGDLIVTAKLRFPNFQKHIDQWWGKRDKIAMTLMPNKDTDTIEPTLEYAENQGYTTPIDYVPYLLKQFAPEN
jgi:hypothetical protein